MNCHTAAADARHAEWLSTTDGVFVGAGPTGMPLPRCTSLLLGALPSAVPCARLHARQVLWEWGLSEAVENAELLVSELVTNGVKAARATGQCPPVQVHLCANRLHLLVEVWDGNTQAPVPPELENDVPALDADGGRGLFLVQTLSERWGWCPTRSPEGKVIWCELRVPTAPG